MGGWGSGRQDGRPTADTCFRIDLAWMLRKRLAKAGAYCSGTLRWTRGGEPSGSIGYVAAMNEPGSERLELTYTRTRSGEEKRERQTVMLTWTVPNFGGKRWWMLCPFNGERVGKLYLPPGGDIFASRTAWRLGYHSQRIVERDAVFERLFRLQSKLGSPEGYESPLFKPKGMWQRTWQRHLDEYWQLDAQCARELMAMAKRIGVGSLR